MEMGFFLSYGAFIAEAIVFLFGMFQATKNSGSDGVGQRVPAALVWLLAVLAAVALMFPVLFIMSHPESLATAHPLSMALLVGAPSMPIILLLFGRRR